MFNKKGEIIIEFTDSCFLSQTRTQGWNDETMSRVRALIFGFCERGMSKKIMEIGCGNGVITCFAAERYPEFSFTGIDIDTELVREAKKKAKLKQIHNVRFRVSDINKEADAQYDMVYTHYTLVDTKEPEKLFDSMFRLVCEDGVMCCAEPLYQCDCNNVYMPFLTDEDKYTMNRILRRILIEIPRERGIDRLFGMRLPEMFNRYGLKETRIDVVAAYEYSKEYTNERKQQILKNSNEVLEDTKRYRERLEYNKLFSLLGKEDLDAYTRLQYVISECIVNNPEHYFSTGNFTYSNMIIIKGKKEDSIK